MAKPWLKMLLTASAFIAPAAHAQWRTEAMQFAAETFAHYPYKSTEIKPYGREQECFLATLWGGARRAVDVLNVWRASSVDVNLPEMFEHPLAVNYDVHMGRTVKILRSGGQNKELVRYFREKAPVMVFVPGVFSNADGGSGHDYLKLFSYMGYHVIMLPNPWGLDYLSARAKPIMPSPEFEGRALIEVAKKVIHEQIGDEWVTDVYVAGESMGAAMAAVAYGIDSRDGDKGLFARGSATLIWPPVSMSKSMKVIDRYMAQNKQLYKDKCEAVIGSLGTKLRLVNGSIVTDPTDEERECAAAIVTQHAFRGKLVRNAKFIDDMNKSGPSRDLKGDALDQWERDMNFMSYIQHYFPTLAEPVMRDDPSINTMTWINEARRNGRNAVQIISAADDFINYDTDWATAMGESTLVPEHNLILTPWGGHVGYSPDPNFDKLLHLQFDQKN